MSPEFDFAALASLGAVIVIDIVLSGDNAIILGLAASGLEPERRGRVIFYGVALATLLRVALAFVAVPLLAIVGLTLAGGLLLLWVAWKIWRETRHELAPPTNAGSEPASRQAPKTMRQAIFQVALADLSLSLDNVLAVAGAAHQHPWVLGIGLALSIALMAFAAHAIARYLGRYPWLVYVGLAAVALVAINMILEGSAEVLQSLGYV
ncbi:MAG TPA: YjbE family putative metal transport protein [Alphaproteobacteria bacterium]|nr:YjbE family putative metal transport protein [Alphaproteobacteria bacterium]